MNNDLSPFPSSMPDLSKQAIDSSCRGGLRTQGIFAAGTDAAPLVTVITATFNAAPFVENVLRSVSSQDYPNVEHIVLDAGSKDGTKEILQAWSSRLALWMSEPDRGIYDAWNKGLDLARGEWIAFLGADDVYQPGAIRAYMELARQNPEAEYLSSRMQLLHPAGYTRVQGSPWEWPKYCRYMCSPHVGSMHRRSLFEKYGKYDLSYPISADYEFLLRPRDRLKAAYLPAITLQMRGGGMSESIASLKEAARAKIETGGRSAFAGNVELRLGITKFRIKQLLHRLLQWLRLKRPAANPVSGTGSSACVS